MSTTRFSQSPYLLIASSVFGTIWFGFGLNAIIRPQNALTFFEFEVPASAPDRKLVDSLMIVYGARDIFMGLAVYAAAYYGHRRIAGWMLIAGSVVAFGDGAVCWNNGHGEWNHWGYAPMLTVIGGFLLGILDR